MELRIKPLGILVLLVFLALIGGGVAFWANRSGIAETEQKLDINKQAQGEVLFASSKTKKDWLDAQAERFNAEQKGKVTVKIVYGETRDSYQEIINGKMKPALWAPSSTAWIGALGNYWDAKHGKPLFQTNEADAYKVYLKTPMVFLTTKEKAAFLRPLLSTNGKTWDNTGALASGKIKCPWGAFKYAYADPINSGSGFMTLSMIVTDYASKHPELAGTSVVVKSHGFLEHLKTLNSRLVYDPAAFKGSTDLLDSFVEAPSRYDFICTYESNAIKAARENPNFVVLYPNPTATVDMSIVCFTGADWLTPQQKAASKLFMQFLGEKAAMEAGVKTAFRTASETPGVSLNTTLNTLAAQGFQESFVAAELPSYEPVNDAADAWRRVTPTPATVLALQRQKEREEVAKAK